MCGHLETLQNKLTILANLFIYFFSSLALECLFLRTVKHIALEKWRCPSDL